MLGKPWESRADRADGFTLIELLVVVVILGVLIAIAIPLYLNYRKGANDAATQSDVRNAISVMEVCNSNTGSYPLQIAAVTWTATTAPCTGQQINLSSGTSLKYISAAAGVTYMIVGTNSNGNTKYYCYNSAIGGRVAAVTSATLAAATC